MMKIVRRMGMFAAALVLLVICAICAYSWIIKSEAERALRASYELSLQDRPPGLRDLQRRFGNALGQPDPCTPSGCKYEVMVSNWPLAKMRVFAYATLSSSFWVKDGVVQENIVQLFTALHVAYADIRYCDGCNGFDAIPCGTPNSNLASGSVRIGSNSEPRQKLRAFGFNASCLSSVSGCATLADIFPAVWHRTASGKLECSPSGQSE